MTIDERLERLTLRHEALTQSVELIAIAQRHSEELIDRNVALLEKNQVLMEKNQVLMAGMIEA